MIVDCREWKDSEQIERERSRVFVDGVEILKVWYLDTDLGIVKTYDLGDGRELVLNEQKTELISRTVEGVVELKPWLEVTA